jgi:hypothetical protein
MEIERGGNVHDGKRAAGVAGTRCIKSYQIVAAHIIGGFLEFFDGITPDNFSGDGVFERHFHLLDANYRF